MMSGGLPPPCYDSSFEISFTAEAHGNPYPSAPDLSRTSPFPSQHSFFYFLLAPSLSLSYDTRVLCLSRKGRSAFASLSFERHHIMDITNNTFRQPTQPPADLIKQARQFQRQWYSTKKL